jgi:hypothetical protein
MLWIVVVSFAVPLCAQSTCNCTEGDLISGGMTQPEGVDVDDIYAYVGAADNILRRVPKIGGTPETIATAPQAIGVVRVDQNNVYFTTFADRNIDGTGALYIVPKTGGSAQRIVTGRIYAMTIDDTYIYWGDFNGAIYRISKRGNSDIQQLASVSYPLGLLIDGNDLYYSDANIKAIIRIAKTGGAQTVIAQGQTVNFMTTDGTNLYATGLLAPTIFKVPKSGGTLEPLGSLQTFASGIRYVNGVILTATDDNSGPHGALMAIDPVSGSTAVVRGDRAAAHTFAVDACAIYLPHWNNGGTLEKICLSSVSTVPPHHRAAKH